LKIYIRVGKRIVDVSVSLILVVLLAPCFALLVIGVRSFLGSPTIFRQVRAGKGGEPFTLLKLRSMTNQRDSSGNLLPDAERLTKFGKWLRSTSLDELPEILNVLRGDMSLVGPRPLLIEYVPRYTMQQARRHEVRPGLSGWAQVNGRNAMDWGARLEMDTWYVDNVSLNLDLRILWLTVGEVLGRRGISHEGEATMPPFTG
jgi:lipopolysaccharide/colanic/teichoic acid biosynthesis glycosyltransferase